ncbi:peptide chain release factor N(5)-glutamine methyltransferase [Helicobacter mehlei]|uniref:peptide chain release factor N(5)-glutamine methyltransferase n=1 Tax=Helicobacter mehlei TaxID=2316080 RepID=A0A553V0N9_9HELI|nr:peptide chain release factor N(5)-glutamine methyltransferase [Helicobacter mehlei]TSA85781.1 peptide chain release factor N(5)-glutamine methyltransferase [Helicobacter mehlei]
MDVNISKALYEAKRILKDKGMRPALESETLLSHLLGVDRVYLHMHAQEELDAFAFEHFMHMVKVRSKGKPLEYITHEVSFYGRSFFVDERVLIPRPETEILVHQASQIIQDYGIKNVVEVGIGSGVVSVSLAIAHPKISILATDISMEALEVASVNIATFNLQNRISLFQTSLMEGVDIQARTLVVSNPPYVALDYPLDASVRYEPEIALYGGEQGDEIIKALINEAAHKRVRYLVCEMGATHRASLSEYLGLKNYQASFYSDYAGLDRGFVAIRQTN